MVSSLTLLLTNLVEKEVKGLNSESFPTAGNAAYPPQTEQQVEIHRVTWQALDCFPTDVLKGATSFIGDPVIPDKLHECEEFESDSDPGL